VELRLVLVWLEDRVLSIFESPPKDSLATLGEGPGKALEGAAAFHQSLALVACYDGTMRRDEINRQCTPAHLEVKRKSTGK
jgi:hypothetical protein